MTEQTRAEAKTAELAALFAARVPIIWIATTDETWVKRHIKAAADSKELGTHFWDVALGSYDLKGNPEQGDGLGAKLAGSPVPVLKAIRQRTTDAAVWVLADFDQFLTGQTFAPVIRELRSMADWLPKQPLGSIVILSTSAEVPAGLPEAKLITWPLPERSEIKRMLAVTCKRYEGEPKVAQPADEIQDAAVDAAIGLNAADAQTCFAKSIASVKRIDPLLISAEKEAVVAKFGGVQWIKPLPGGFDVVGGNEVAIEWILKRSNAHTPAARTYGVPTPKGLGLVGVPGCGKSLLIMAAASALGVPLIRVDMGSLKGKFVGESEAKLRQVFDMIDTLGYCWVWIDEIEKALDGATSGSADGGVSADALGFLLTWMQERKSSAFVVITANDTRNLPPELLRKGRFDELFWVGFPHTQERKSILAASLRRENRSEVIDLDAVAAVTEHFTGAEIADLVRAALYTGFYDGARPITTGDIIAAAKESAGSLLYHSRGKEMEERRRNIQARDASLPEAVVDNSSDGPLIRV